MTAPEPTHDVDPAFESRVRALLDTIEERLLQAARADTDLVTGAAQHIIAAGGKRFRPMLVVLSALLGTPRDDDDLARAALVMELTHVASLYHDDVMDEAEIRRGADSANSRWDNTVAILVGDFLFARASDQVAELGPDFLLQYRISLLDLVPGGQTWEETAELARRLEAAGVTEGLSIESRKPDWLRPKVHLGPEVVALKKTMRELSLVTVCEDAGCPNLSECWGDGTATFMVLGERCTRACGFCLVDTSKPLPPAADEPQRVAEAVDRMGLDHAVLTMVARDDLADGGMAHVAACVEAIRARRPQTAIETLVSDARGDGESLRLLFTSRPDVFNHNVETVARLQRAVRPSAGYARSLSVLARAKAAGLVTKSGVMVGLGETDEELVGCAVGISS